MKKPPQPEAKRPNPNKDGAAKEDTRPYRSGVGIALFNRHGQVLVAERLDNVDSWQMPQGGIDEGEAPEAAVFREMEEEIGTRDARILGVMKDWLRYDLPARTAKKLWSGKYRGQQQKWIALEFLGNDADIDLEAFHEPEFSRWKWVDLSNLLDYVVPFKRDIYRRVMEEFGDYAAGLAKKHRK